MIPGKRQIKIKFLLAERSKAFFRSIDTIKYIAGSALGLGDCIVRLWRSFLVEVVQTWGSPYL